MLPSTRDQAGPRVHARAQGSDRSSGVAAVGTPSSRSGVRAPKKACDRFGDGDPASLTADDVAGWASDLAGTFKPGTVQLYPIAFLQGSSRSVQGTRVRR